VRRLFFVDEVSRGRAEIRGDHAFHLTRVLRVEAGQRYEISDNQSLYLAQVESARKDLVSFSVLEPLEIMEAPVKITLLASLIKFDRFEWILEKSTELGVSAIVPVESERSERGLERAAGKRIARWRRIVLESAQQCRRARLPELQEPVPLRNALNVSSKYRFLLDERRGVEPFLRALPREKLPSDEVAVLLGPEGGWADHEHESSLSLGWSPVSIGWNVLRAETAAAAALAIIGAAWQAGAG
jgi:16S rRNA (uracil1498-N3)-methyltransferase